MFGPRAYLVHRSQMGPIWRLSAQTQMHSGTNDQIWTLIGTLGQTLLLGHLLGPMGPSKLAGPMGPSKLAGPMGPI